MQDGYYAINLTEATGFFRGSIRLHRSIIIITKPIVYACSAVSRKAHGPLNV